MARIPSPNPDFSTSPYGTRRMRGFTPDYLHPAARRKNHPIPMAFQVTSPFSRTKVLLPHTLVLHVNPSSVSESYNQKVERFQTRGGYQEQHWGQDLTEVSADASTGAFMNIYSGLSSVIRQRTIAWDRYRDLHDLYLNNGSVYDPFGNIVLQGHIMLMYDRGTYLGTFRSFEVEETEDSPFAFKINWSFKIEYTFLSVPFTAADDVPLSAPPFQGDNLPVSALDARSRSAIEQSAAEQGISVEEAINRQDEAEQAAEERRKRNAEMDAQVDRNRSAVDYVNAAKKFDEEGPGNIFQPPDEPPLDKNSNVIRPRGR